MYTRGFWNFQFRTAPSHAERARYFSTSKSGLWCIPKKPELLVSTTTLYPFLSHGPTIARGGQVHRTIFSTRIKGWFKKRERKIPTNEEIYPFLRSFQLSLRFSSFRHTLQSRSHFSQDSLIYHPPPLETYFPTLNVPPSPNSVPLHPLSARSFPPPLTILTLFPPPLDRRPSSLFLFPVRAFHHSPSLSRSYSPRSLFREHHLHNPPALPSRARPALSTGPIIFIANRLIRPLHFRVISFTWKLVHVNPTRSWRHRPPHYYSLCYLATPVIASPLPLCLHREN